MIHRFLLTTFVTVILTILPNTEAEARCVGETLTVVGKSFALISSRQSVRAKRRAERKWNRNVSRRFGKAFASAGFAKNRKMKCIRIQTTDGDNFGTQCTLSAEPCDSNR